MNDERLDSISAFAKQLRAHLAVSAEDDPEIPDEATLDRLVEVAFFASLHEEEGRRTDPTIAWMGGTKHCSAVVELVTPVPATPKSIAKLGPAARRGSTSLAVRADAGELVIWALLSHGSAVDEPLSIRSLAAGVLRIDYRGVPRALYARGEMLFLGSEPSVASPARRLTEAFACWASAATEPPRVDARAATVTRLASRMLLQGHGGMILLLPGDGQPRGVRTHYAVARGGDLLATRFAAAMVGADAAERLARVDALRDARDPARTRGAELARFDHALDVVASLTATDNALLLDAELHVRGFGVQVIEGEAPLEPFAHVNPYSGQSHIDDISTFKGTRHPAGVIFCLRQEREAAAIIASQDGRLSLVVKDARGTVEVLGSYERGFGWR